MATLLEYKCPSCGGAIAFDSGVQKLKCPYCDTEFDIDTLREFDDILQSEAPDEMHWDTDTQEAWQEDETQELRSYVCESCGGEIIGDATTAATACPFCGNPVVMPRQLSGMLKPDLVIPFQLDKNAAREALRRHYSGKKLLPRTFQDENHIDEVKGLYVPVWLFDASADANIRYHGITLHHWSDKNYNYTETRHYAIHRAGSVAFAAIPVDGSEKMPNDMMESIEPFDLSQGVDFKTAYLAGYFADRYDVDAKESIVRANERIRVSTEEAFRSTINGFINVVAEHSDIHMHEGRIRYALYPVWLLNTTWNGQQYHFLMNGQTGKLVGDLPVDKKLSGKYFRRTAAIVAAAALAVQALLWLLS